MGGRGASSGSVGGKSTPDGKFTVGNTYRIQNDNAGVDYDYVVTDVNNKMVVGKITNFRQGFFNQYEGAPINFQTNSIAYNQATLLKESEKNATARGNRMRKEIQSIRNKLDKAGIKYPAGSSLENLRYRYNALKKIGKIK
ncbi:MAG TPA: hypothetical protein OIM45_04870 [Clostridiaceae bacterium]|nr:hypothetical protein [Clostridiaceae bacterium]